MRNREPDPRRRRVQIIAAIVALAALLWALLIRDSAPLDGGQYAVGWLFVAALVAFLVTAFWRGRK